MPKLFALFFLPPLVEDGGQIKLPLVEDIESNKKDDPEISKETKGCVASIDKF